MSSVIETVAGDATKLLVFFGLALLFLGGGIGVELVSVVGLVLLVGGPIVGGTVGDVLETFAEERDSGQARDPLEELRGRYARGELTEAEFESKVERLLETEDVEIPGWSDGPDGGTDTGDGTSETTREPEPEIFREE